jgi:pimeloyl-ACP methyl ester carboxylesterase
LNAATNCLVARQCETLLPGPLGSFDAYADRVSRIAVLSREDEHALAKRFRVIAIDQLG